MRKAYRYGIAALLTMASVTSGPVLAETVVLKAELSASNHLPPTSSKGTGAVTATYDTTSKVLIWKGTHSGLTGPATSAHFHGPAPAGQSAGVAIWISSKGSPLPESFEGQATLTDAQADDMMAGRWYVNIHTRTYPGGEIRGQLELAK